MGIRIIIACISIGLFELSTAVAQSGRESANEALAAGYFQTSDHCIACHSNLHASDGTDVSIGYTWRSSMMANSGRDPYWHAGVRREVMDHPSAQSAIEDKCSTCHMPMHRFDAAHMGGTGHVFDNIFRLNAANNLEAIDGVSCTVCHQVRDDNFGESSSFEGGFSIDTTTPREQRPIYASHDVDAGRQRVMRSASSFVPTESDHLRRSELCATCHTLFTEALDDSGQSIGELPEQVPYLEWRHSEYRTTRSCQDCHMPELSEDTAISSVLGQPRPGFLQHVFRGGNAFVIGILNRYRDELGVRATTGELAAGIRRTRDFLANDTATVSIESARRSGTVLEFGIHVENLAGHKLPTAYPSRRVWLHVRVRDAEGRVVFESGAPRDDGSIEGNDNDEDALRYEPHYELITAASQVQIYEPILVDSNDRVTTGLLRGIRYIKDNRLLPRGFDKSTADEEVAAKGAAVRDADFGGGEDTVRYRIDAGRGALDVDVELLYQSIGYRWANNLRDYRATETDRFVGFFEENARNSAMQLGADSLRVE